MISSNRKSLPAAVCNYACTDCGHVIAVMPYTMEARQFCSSCGGSMWKLKGIRGKGESSGCGSDKAIDAQFHRSEKVKVVPMVGRRKGQ